VSADADPIVLVTPRSYREADDRARSQLEAEVGEVRYNDLGRAMTADELRAALADVDGVIAGLDPYDEGVLAAAPRLRCIARYGIGTEAVDLDAAAQRGIVVTNTPDANANAVAELALGLILALLRGIHAHDRRARAGEWRPQAGDELAGSTAGIVGLGRVGSALAAKLTALGARVVAHDPYVDARRARELDVELVAIDELLSSSLVVSLHAPVSARTRDLIDAEALTAMPRGAVLVNAARGELVVEEDLASALDRGHLRGAALDSLREEPPNGSNPLVGRDDVILTPHIGAQTRQARRAMAQAATADLIAVLKGRAPRHPVAPSTARSRG
jgi:D-3-phosphoglycerate dehydrogenase / 2-oxoglutarate reductase